MATNRTASGKIKVPLRHSTKPGANQKPDNDGQWWAASTKKLRASQAWDTIQMLSSAHGPRFMTDAAYNGLYENEPPYWMNAGVTQAPGSPAFVTDDSGRRVPVNGAKSVIDTAAAMLSKNLAEVRAYTNGGKWRDQKRARGMTKYISGVFQASQFHRHQQLAFIDGCCSRARGAVKFWGDTKTGAIKCGRAHPRTLLWNDLEGSDPRSFYQNDQRAKESLLRQFGSDGKAAEAIAKAPEASTLSTLAFRKKSILSLHADMVDVGEAWHLGYNGEEDSGRHILTVNGYPLVDEPWPLEMFPFVFFTWEDSDEGWGGRPLIKQLAPYQLEINRYLRIHRKALERAAAMAGAWLERTSEVVEDEYQNGEPWTARSYVGQPPVFAAPPALGPDFFQFIGWLYDKMLGEAGISELQAQGTKPAGLDAAVAMREYNDITATRQVVKGQRYERMTVDAGNLIIALSKRLFKDHPDLMVRAPGKKEIELISFKDVDMEADAFVLRTDATSALPTHFTGKLQTVIDMIRGGVIPDDQVKSGLGLRLLQMPDLEKEADNETASRDLAQMQVDECLYEGNYVSPEPYQDPQQLLTYAQNAYLHSQAWDDCPKKNRQLLERLMSQAESMLPANNQPPATPGQQQGGLGAAAFAPQGGPPVAAPVVETPAVPVPQQAPPSSPAIPSAAPAGVL